MFGSIFVEPACCELDIIVTVSVRVCVCIVSGFVQAITSIFMHEFQSNLAQLFSLRRSVI